MNGRIQAAGGYVFLTLPEDDAGELAAVLNNTDGEEARVLGRALTMAVTRARFMDVDLADVTAGVRGPS